MNRPDPYAWLADKLSQESVDYLNAERAHYEHAVAPLSKLTETLYDEMTARVLPQDDSVHWREGDFEYFTRTIAGQDYQQLCRTRADGPPELLLDENLLLGDSDYVEVGVREVSPDGRLLAYSVDLDGDEVYELRFRDLTTGEDLSETVGHTYYSGAWSADSSFFFYVVHDDLYRPYQAWRHRIGSQPDEDVLVLEDTDEQYDVAVRACRSGELVVIRTYNRVSSEEWLVDARRPEEPARWCSRASPGWSTPSSTWPGPAAEGCSSSPMPRRRSSDWWRLRCPRPVASTGDHSSRSTPPSAWSLPTPSVTTSSSLW